MKVPTINWKATLLTLWVIFSFAYITYNMYDNFKTNVIQNAYLAGQNDTVKALITQAENKECKPFNVYAGDKKVDLINVTCLQQAAPKTPETK
ncbi:MAG: hypothetical protein ACD_71C00087G0003 [uncultured bacterium (gcode 4)]|uniref:Uncharacterized protein n=1 Tax=uncultured bacterium (gcode 4) TaxID=1234023 RepID=K1ZJJ0_9BACT|nr:MAG: hypothetical protein ACD_71C00087G0003 [uncultured bacterium (gcode 4)]